MILIKQSSSDYNKKYILRKYFLIKVQKTIFVSIK